MWVTFNTLPSLPPVGLFDQMKADKTLSQSSAFTAVGYGDGNKQVGGGQPPNFFDGFRWNSTSFFNALTTSCLRLTQNASVGWRHVLRRLRRAELHRRDRHDRGDHDHG